MSGTYSGSDKRLAYLFENGGGGGGGSSTLAGLDDVNLSLPSDGQVLKYDGTNDEWINGDESGGCSGGCFIDTSNVIKATTSISRTSTATYTATQDCAIVIIFVTDYDKASEIKVDNVRVWRIYDGLSASGQIVFSYVLFAKQGQVITMTNGSTSFDGSYMVYGILGSSGGTTLVQPVIYSEEEREVGVWIDGKPLYQKTLEYSGSYSDSVSLSIGIANIDTVTVDNCFALDNSDAILPLSFSHTYSTSCVGYFISADKSSLNLRIGSTNSLKKVVVTFKYTKTTDTAGSGSWTPSGAPAHHYSTNEQIVGTWVDGKTLYEKTFYVASSTGNQYPTIADISGLNIDTVVNATGICTNIDNYKLPLPYSHYQANYSICFLVNDTKTNLEMRIGSGNTSLTDIYCTLLYTKSS